MELVLPRDEIEFDHIVGEYICYLWWEGDPVGWATDCLSGLQHHLTFMRRKFFGSWRLVGGWQKKEMPSRAPPFSPLLTLGVAGAFLAEGALDIAVLICVGFLAFLRTGEIFGLQKRHLEIVKNRVIITLESTKTSVRRGITEVVTFSSALVAQMLRLHLADLRPGDYLLRRSAASARALFKEVMIIFELSDFSFQWYSLRRGGASWDFSTHGSMELTLLRGRWQSSSTARVYVNEALASQTHVKMSSQSTKLLRESARQIVLLLRKLARDRAGEVQ